MIIIIIYKKKKWELIFKGMRIFGCIAYSLFHIAKNRTATRSIIPAKELGFLALH